MIRQVLLIAALVTSATAAPVPKAIKKRDDAKLLEGRWQGVTVDTGGGPTQSGDYWFEVRDGKLTTGIGQSEGYKQRVIRLDANTSPKQIDVDDTRGQFHLGVYELDGDTITWCESSSTTNRPAELTTAGGFNVLVYKRAKE